MTPDDFLAFAKSSGIYDFMSTKYGWPFIESVHFIALSILLGSVGLFDLRLMGFAKGVSLSALHYLVPFGVVAYGINIITGVMFFVTVPDQYMYNPAFQTKLGLMGLAGVNMVLFYLTTARVVKALDPDCTAPALARVMGAVSLAAWIGIIVCGRLITVFRPPSHWCFWCS